MENNIASIMMVRLINGDEIVGKVSVIQNMIKIVKPAAVMIQPGAAGKAQMALVDFIPMAKSKEIVLDPRNVLFTYDPDDQIEDAYQQNFGSLLLPRKGILTPTS
jgi:hypothetical protein